MAAESGSRQMGNKYSLINGQLFVRNSLRTVAVDIASPPRLCRDTPLRERRYQHNEPQSAPSVVSWTERFRTANRKRAEKFAISWRDKERTREGDEVRHLALSAVESERRVGGLLNFLGKVLMLSPS